MGPKQKKQHRDKLENASGGQCWKYWRTTYMVGRIQTYGGLGPAPAHHEGPHPNIWWAGSKYMVGRPWPWPSAWALFWGPRPWPGAGPGPGPGPAHHIFGSGPPYMWSASIFSMGLHLYSLLWPHIIFSVLVPHCIWLPLFYQLPWSEIINGCLVVDLFCQICSFILNGFLASSKW